MKISEKQVKLARMPRDYRPSKPLEFIGLDIDKREGFDALTDAEAGQVIKRLFEYAVDYSDSFDESLQPDLVDLSQLGAFLLRICCSSFKRMEDSRRETSFLRSGGNGGGRPPIDD